MSVPFGPVSPKFVLDAANVVEPGDEICARALRLLEVHPLRPADALQLAAALPAVLEPYERTRAQGKALS